MASKKVKILLAGAVGIGLVALMVKNRKSLTSKPDLFLKSSLPGNYNAMTLPPIGIFVRADQSNNAELLQHELVHWQQYQRMGLLRYYGTYLDQLFTDGYDRMALEMEARGNETPYCRQNYTQCVRSGTAKTVSNQRFRNFS